MGMGKLQSKNKVTILKYELHDQHVHEIPERHGSHGDIVADDTDNPGHRTGDAGGVFFKKIRYVVVHTVISGRVEIGEHESGVRGLGSNGTVNTVKWGSGVEPLP